MNDHIISEFELINVTQTMSEEQARVKMCKHMLAQGIPQREICRLLNMSASTISRIKKSGDEPFCIGKRGRKKVVSQEMRDFIEANLSVDAMITDGQMAHLVGERFGMTISDTTVCRVRNELGFRYRPPKIRQVLTEDQVSLRLEFCRWVLEHQDAMKNLIFSDESRFTRGPDCTWRRIRRGEWNDTCFLETQKFPQGIMVWGAVGVSYRSPLVRCSGGVNAQEYVAILEQSEMVSKLNMKHGCGNWTFIQDGAPAHKAKDVCDYLTSQKVVVMPGWPPNSPDLNPIEMLWGVMKRRIRGKTLECEDMFALLKDTWQIIAEDVINRLVLSFIDRCKLVMQLGGASATPYLSSHRNWTPPIALPAPIWTPEEDAHLLRLHEIHGRRWTAIGAALRKKPLLVHHRFAMLDQIARNQAVRRGRAVESVCDDDLLPAMDIQEFLRAMARPATAA